LERVAHKEIDRLLLLCPPQHGKSWITSKRFPAWLLGIDPTLDIISSSATTDLATEFGGAVRDVVRSPEYKDLFPGTQLSESSQAKGRWETSQGGGYYAVGIGGALFGRGASLGVVDDPFSTWEDAQSVLAKSRAWEWYRGTLYNRIRPGGAIIVIQHRTGEDDLVGRLLEEESHGGDKWTVVNLKADLEDPPWPERYNREALERIRANISPMMWSALYLQNPIPDDGTFFKKDWFTDFEELPKGLKIYGATDGAVSKGEGDFTEHGIIGVDTSRNIYVLDWWYGQESADVWIDKMADLVNEHEPSCWFGESGPIRKAVEPFMVKRLTDRDAFVRIEWIPSIQDKETRATGIQGLMSMGKVFWPKNAKWKAHVQEQMLRFPAGKYDDAVDVMGLFGRGLKFVNSSKKRVVRRIMEPVRSWMAG
jgi:predicted phage terminase large subunit-like protein